jgi:hypothetical protein
MTAEKGKVQKSTMHFHYPSSVKNNQPIFCSRAKKGPIAFGKGLFSLKPEKENLWQIC